MGNLGIVFSSGIFIEILSKSMESISKERKQEVYTGRDKEFWPSY